MQSRDTPMTELFQEPPITVALAVRMDSRLSGDCQQPVSKLDISLLIV